MKYQNAIITITISKNMKSRLATPPSFGVAAFLNGLSTLPSISALAKSEDPAFTPISIKFYS